MSTPSLATLLIRETKAAIYRTALGIATAVGLPVSSWQAGDPTRSLYNLESEILSSLEETVAGYIASGFLDYATGVWLKIVAKQVFDVDVPEATFATTDVLLTNGGGGVYDYDPGDITFKNTLTGKQYHNTTGGHLASLGTLTVSVVADEAGSDSSAGAGEIDELVTTSLGVTCTNAVAAVGIDEQDEATTRQQCRDKLGSFSPNGPKDAYSYVARNSALTGVSNITRVRVYGDSETGDVTVYLAGPSGAVSEPDRAAVEVALVKWATPICITLTVLSATAVTVAVTYELWIYKSCNEDETQIKAKVQAALEALFVGKAIGGDIIPPVSTGKLYLSHIESVIRGTYPQVFRVALTLPAADVALLNTEVAALGTVAGTVNILSDP